MMAHEAGGSTPGRSFGVGSRVMARVRIFTRSTDGHNLEGDWVSSDNDSTVR
jgi:hypothetical protein